MKSKELILVAIWCLCIGAGFAALSVYSSTPSGSGRSVNLWPLESAVRRQRDRLNLIVFLHPKCACSRATVGELERLMVNLKDRVDLKAVFLKPTDAQDEWVRGYAWNAVQRLSGQESVIDPGGIEAKRFGVETSGQVLLYDQNGGLLFRGGITPSRGHMGNSAGRKAILGFFEEGNIDLVKESPVFGCSIRKTAAFESTE